MLQMQVGVLFESYKVVTFAAIISFLSSQVLLLLYHFYLFVFFSMVKVYSKCVQKGKDLINMYSKKKKNCCRDLIILEATVCSTTAAASKMKVQSVLLQINVSKKHITFKDRFTVATESNQTFSFGTLCVVHFILNG